MVTMPAPFVSTPLVQSVMARIQSGHQLGANDAARWASSHATRDDQAFLRFEAAAVGAPPSGAAAAAELGEVRQVVAHRTPTQDATATFLEANGERSVWREQLHAWQSGVSTADAQRGAALLESAMSLTQDLVKELKQEFHRPRPYAADGTLTTIPSVTTTNPRTSFPSGHAAGAFAAATVMASLMPDRAAEFTAMAEQVAFSRVYCAVHFPSDVAAAARIGAAIAQYEIGMRA